PLDAVLSATPEDRRGYIEEAAGILKHRRRKERNLRKLEAMDTNLTRLNALAGEIRRQLKPLGRQAEVARQAGEIAAEVRDAKARLLADDVLRVRRELDELSKDESERHSERIVLNEQLEQKQLRIARLEEEQRGDELDTARRVTIALESAQSKLRGMFSQAQQRVTFLATQGDGASQSTRLGRAAVDEAAAEAERLDALIPAAQEAWERAASATREAQRALDAIDEHIAAQSALVSKHDLRLSQLRGRAEIASAKRHAGEQDVARRAHAVEQAEARASEAQHELTEFEAAVESSDDVAGEAGTSAREHAHRAAEELQTAAELARDAAREKLHGLEQERAGLDARIGALTRSLDQRDASGQVIDDAMHGVKGRVADHVRVESGYEAAIGAALGVYVDALLVEEHEDASDVVRTAAQRDLGRLRAVIAREAG